MDTKLTLKLDDGIIEHTKRYASRRKISLSKMIEQQLDLITREEQTADIEISPFVKSIANGKRMSDNRDWKELRSDYLDYLDNKHR